ncbi:helix-turn-helix transcriptional regulator [Staphylococcus rostri]
MAKINYPVLYIARKEHGHTQTYVAQELGISPQRYSLKELGNAYFTLPEAKKLSEIYDIPIEQLFSTEFPVAQ